MPRGWGSAYFHFSQSIKSVQQSMKSKSSNMNQIIQVITCINIKTLWKNSTLTKKGRSRNIKNELKGDETLPAQTSSLTPQPGFPETRRNREPSRTSLKNISVGYSLFITVGTHCPLLQAIAMKNSTPTVMHFFIWRLRARMKYLTPT